MRSSILLKDPHLFKIAKIEYFFKQKLIIDSTILNKWESFSETVDKCRGPPEDGIISHNRKLLVTLGVPLMRTHLSHINCGFYYEFPNSNTYFSIRYANNRCFL